MQLMREYVDICIFVHRRIYIYMYVCVRVGEGPRRYCPKEKLPLIATSTGRMKLGFTTGAVAEGERKGAAEEGRTVENTYLLPRSRRINLFVGGAVRFLGRYYTRGRE